MSHELDETDTYDDTDKLVVPDPGDARKAASVVGPFQQIANHARWLKTRIQEIFDLFQTELDVQDLIVDGDLDVDGTANLGGPANITGTITAGANIQAVGVVGGLTGLAGGFQSIADQAGAEITCGPGTGATRPGVFFRVGDQSVATTSLKFPSSGVGSGYFALIHLDDTSPEAIVIKNGAGTTIAILTPGRQTLIVFDTDWEVWIGFL